MLAQLLRRSADLRARRAASGDRGFSLIELIVVVAILGILIAIAIPVFGTIQQTARNNAAMAVASNAATQAAAQIAAGEPVDVSNLETDDIEVSVVAGSPASIEAICATAKHKDGDPQQSGPDC